MCALVIDLSRNQAALPFAVFTVTLCTMGTRISGWVFRQKDNIEMHMKNTETTPMVCESKQVS